MKSQILVKSLLVKSLIITDISEIPKWCYLPWKWYPNYRIIYRSSSCWTIIYIYLCTYCLIKDLVVPEHWSWWKYSSQKRLM